MSTSTPDYNRFADVYDDPRKKKKKGGRSVFYMLGVGCLGCMSICLVVCAIAGTGAWAIGRTEAAEESTETYSLDELPDVLLLEVDVENGGVNVIGNTDTNEIAVKVTRKVRSITQERARADLDRFEVDIDDRIADDGLLRITFADDLWAFNGLVPVFRSLEIQVMLPRDIDISLASTNGQISLSDVNLEADGSITTSNGGIKIENVQADQGLTLETSNGSIKIENSRFSGDLNVKTSNGQLDFESIQVEQGGTFTTSNGQIKFAGSIAGNANERYIFETSNAQIELDFSEDSQFFIEASVSNGSLDNNLDLTNSQSSNNSIQGCYDKGETDSDNCADVPLVTVRTSNGSIKLDGD